MRNECTPINHTGVASVQLVNYRLHMSQDPLPTSVALSRIWCAVGLKYCHQHERFANASSPALACLKVAVIAGCKEINMDQHGSTWSLPSKHYICEMNLRDSKSASPFSELIIWNAINFTLCSMPFVYCYYYYCCCLNICLYLCSLFIHVYSNVKLLH